MCKFVQTFPGDGTVNGLNRPHRKKADPVLPRSATICFVCARPSKPMIAVSHPPKRAISFQDTSYGRRSFGRPKSGNIAVLSPHPPVIGPHAPADRAVVILGFADRGSPDLAVRGQTLGRRVLTQVAGIVTPDTILRWYR